MAIELDPIQLNRAAFSILKQRRARAFRTCSIPLAISLILSFLAIHLDSSVSFWLLLPSVFAVASVAVAIHRVILVDSTECEVPPLVVFGAREARLVGAGIGIAVLAIPGLALSIPMMIGLERIGENPFPALSNLLAGFPYCYVGSRLSLVLPATALDQNASYVGSWRDTFGSGLRLTLALMIPSGLSATFSDLGAIFFPDFVEIPALIVDTIAATLAVAVLSLAYQQLEPGRRSPAT